MRRPKAKFIAYPLPYTHFKSVSEATEAELVLLYGVELLGIDLFPAIGADEILAILRFLVVAIHTARADPVAANTKRITHKLYSFLLK